MKKQYKSSMCSCIICHHQFSVKAIHSHYIIKHTEQGKKRHAKNALRGGMKSAQTTNRKYTQRINDYNKKPKLCECCKSVIPYNKRFNNFCSNSCSASVTNKTRNTKSKYAISDNDIRKGQRVCKVSFCKSCGCVIRNKRNTFCKSCLTEQKRELGRAHAKKYNFGGVRPSKRIKYKDVYLGSSYEVELAKSLDANNILWNKPGKFKYIDHTGKKRTYEPDLYLPEYDIYLDPKNDFLINNVNPHTGMMDKEKIKIVEQTHNVRIIILNKNQLTWDKLSKLI